MDARDPQRLRILHLTAGSDAGGLSRYIFDLCAAMHAAGHEVAVAGERGAWHWLFEQAPWPWIDVPLKGGPLKLAAATRTLRRYLDEHPVDLLHTHYRKPTLVARRLQRSVPLPLLYTLHLSHISLNWPWRWFSDFGDHTHVASTEARQWLIDDARVPADQITVIPHGIDPAKFPVTTPADRAAARRLLGLNDSDRVAAYVGRLDDPKNERWLLDLAAQSRSRLPNLRVILAGEGPHEAVLRRRIAAESLADRVFLLGHRDPLPVYQAADALLLPSTREGFSLVCAEAMATGIPALRTRTSGTAELIVEGETGRSVAINHDQFLAAASVFLADSDGLARMGRAAADHVRSRFTFQRQLDQTLELYQRLASRPRLLRGR
jgi:glycogen(starch) synthase